MNEDRNDLPPENSQPSNSRPTSQKEKLSTVAKVGMTLLFGFGFALLLLGIFFVTCLATYQPY